MFAFQVLNGNGDLLDLIRVVDPSSRPNFAKMTKEVLKDYVLKNSRCSALVKVRLVQGMVISKDFSFFVAATLIKFQFCDNFSHRSFQNW